MPGELKDRRLYFAHQYERYLASEIDDYLSPADTMADQWYMSVGVSAAQVIHAACVTSWVHRVEAVLDLPCGHGRVLRHLVKLFPDATFDACDLDRDGVEFCASRFGARPMHSDEDLTKLNPRRTYDLIWVGSLFTHISHSRTRAWLAHLADFLSATGIMVATFHGRFSSKMGREYGYIEESRWLKLLNEYETTGYGYHDYPPKAGHGYIAGPYGISLSNPATVIADAISVPGIRVFSYTERGWAGHQDVLVVGKPDLLA